MKKFGIAAVFALLFSSGLFAQPLFASNGQVQLAGSTDLTAIGITLPIKTSLAPDLVQPMASYSSRAEERLADSFTDLIIEILGILWGYNNLGVTYDNYPYATSPKYMCFDSSNMADFDLAFGNHFYRFALDTSFFSDFGLWMGNSTRFEGLLWKFFGPVIELNSFFNTTDDVPLLQESGYKANLRIGGDFALIQTNPLSAFFYMQWNHYINIDLANSLIVGFIVRSYPIKPVLIEWRVNWQVLQEEDFPGTDGIFFESHLEAGAMVAGPLQVFAAWNFKSYPGFNYKGHGVEAGVRLHF